MAENFNFLKSFSEMDFYKQKYYTFKEYIYQP